MATKNGSVKVSAMKPKNLSFKGRKDCIKKKTMELSVLCDVKACALIIGPDGKLETWPENCNDVLEVLRAFQNYNSKDCKQKKKVAEVRNLEVTMLEAPVPEDPWLPSTSGAVHEGKQGLPSTFDVVRGKEQQGFPLTLDVANQEEHGLPITLKADHQEEHWFPKMLNATDEKELESEHEIDEWFNLEHCLDDSISLNQSEFDAWMNMDLGCYDDHHTLVNQQDWFNDYLI